MNIKRIIAVIIALTVGLSNTVFAKDEPIIADSIIHTVSPGLIYNSSVELHSGYRQEIHSFEYTPGSDTKILPIYGKYIYGTSSVGQGIADYDGESRVVGGINTDFFITTTGVPLSCLIDDREVVSSCDGRAAIGFDEDGNAIIGYPKITSRLYFGDEEFPIAHINKTPAIWGFYLVTDKFYSTTKSSIDSIEIVLRPFVEKTEEKSEEVDTNNESDDISAENPENDEIKAEIEIGDEKVDAETGNVTESEKVIETEGVVDVKDEESEIIFEFSDYTFTDSNIEINSELSLVITEIRNNSMNSEIPEGCFVLCIPKEQFGYTVSHLMVGDELVLKTEISESFENCKNIFGAGDIILENAELTEVPNESVFTSRQPRSAVGIREDGSVVFVCVDGRRKGESHGFTIKELSEYLKSKGCVTALNFDGGGSTTFYAADTGEENANLKNIPSDGYERRVADGLIFLNTAKKGENPSYAAKYPANHLIFNEKVQLSLSGDILFADEKLFPVSHEYDYLSLTVNSEFGETKDNIFTPNGKTGTANVILNAIKGDSSYEFEVGYVNIIDSVSDFIVECSDSLITPFEDSTVLEISVSHNTLPVLYSDESIIWEIYIKDDTVTEETDDAEQLQKATQSEDEVVTDSTENYTEGYTQASINDAIFDNINFEFYPITKGKQYRLIAKLGDSYTYVDIASEKYPFVDTENHWATENIYEMYKSGYFNGEIDYEGNRYFMPHRNMTRSEFCTVVGRILGINIQDEKEYSEEVVDDNSENSVSDIFDVSGDSVIEKEESLVEREKNTEETTDKIENVENRDFYDVPEWAIGYVKALYEMGYIDNLVTYDDNGIPMLEAQKAITRMDVVTVFAKLLDSFEFGNSDEVVSVFSDIADLTLEQKNSVGKLVVSGIIKGYDDNTLRLSSNITRAEVATIFYRYIGLRNFMLDNQSKILESE